MRRWKTVAAGRAIQLSTREGSAVLWPSTGPVTFHVMAVAADEKEAKRLSVKLLKLLKQERKA